MPYFSSLSAAALARPVRFGFALLLAAASFAAQAQTSSVGIGTTAPDASAALDIVASSKGVLLPRLTAAQVAAIALPATGLLVFQTDGPAGFYYNAGQPGSPSWQQLTTAAGTPLSATNGLTLTGSAVGLGGTLTRATTIGLANYPLGLTGGNVGIGTASPATLLDVRTADASAAVTVGKTDNSAGAVYLGNSNHGLRRNYNAGVNNVGLYTTAGSVYLSAAGVDNVNQFALLNGGNVGIGTPTPGQKLEVAGQIYSSTGGIRFPDNTVQTTAATTPNAVLNQTGLQSGASFNIGGNGIIGGNGTIGGLLTAGSAAVSGSVGIGTATPAASAALEVSSTTKGLLPPRLSLSQRDGIASPATGLVIYNTTSNSVNVWDGTRWTEALTANSQPYANAAATFNYTGAVQTYTVPPGVTRLTVDARGAQGAPDAFGSATLHGGAGARVQGQLIVTPGQTLYLYVGQQGQMATSGGSGGGYNGGGNGGYLGGVKGYGGGGATDIRTSASGTAYTDRLLVAAGGGGAGAYVGAIGGAGGLSGNAGGVNAAYGGTAGTGGTQTGPGSPNGAWGQGGNSPTDQSCGGGGGGYYGGGGGGILSNQVAGGGGGSSWTDPAQLLNPSVTAGYNAANGSLTLTPELVYAAPAISGANFVNVPGDNLGNHAATQNLNLGANQLVGNGGSTGLAISSTGSVGLGTAAPAASAQLEVAGTTRGFLPPRLTQEQCDAIASPAPGLVIYNTSTNKLNVWDGTSWTEPLNTSEGSVPPLARTFNYTGAAQTYTVPPNVTSLQVDALGAQGGPGFNSPAKPGGSGARTQAALSVTPGEVLTIYVGGYGTLAPSAQHRGGYNGGGTGYNNHGGGGGATDIRRGAAALADRLLVAGGGGGAGDFNNGGNAGFVGTGGTGSYLGGGGTQAAGGSGLNPGATGSLGQGGNADAGGGGGYYGGGGGYDASGGGGSSYVTPTGSSAITYTSAVNNAGNGVLTLTPIRALPAPFLSGANITSVPAASLTGSVPAASLTSVPAASLTGVVAAANLPTLTSSASGSTRTISLGTGNSTSISVGDDLGSHTATQALNLDTNALVGNGGSTGLTISSTGNVGLGTTAAQPATQKLDVRGNLRLGADGGGSATGTGQTIEFVGPGLNTDPVGLYRINPASDQSELRVVVGDGVDANDKFVVGRSSASAEGGIPGSTFAASFTVRGDGNVGIGTSSPSQKLDVAGNANITGNTTVTGNSYVSGNVGIGTSSPHPLAVKAGAASNSPLLGFYSQAGADKYNFSLSGGGLNLSESGVAGGRLFVQDGGNVGIGTSSPGQKLDVNGNANVGGGATIGGDVGIGTASPQAGLHLDRPESGSSTALGVLLGGGSSGNPSLELRGSGKTPYIDFVENTNLDYSTRLLSTGGTLNLNYGGTAGAKPAYIFNVGGGIQCTAFSNTSDARFKQHVRPLTSALAGVLALRGVRYDWNPLGVQHGGTAGVEQVGLLAQEVEKIYPELVTTGADGYKAVNYAQLAPVLIEALKEQQQQIEALKARAATAEAKASQATATTAAFEARLRALEAGSGQARR
jgi:hypothetical protein